MSKLHVGLITEDQQCVQAAKSALKDAGNHYLHHATSLLQMFSKLNLQKINFLFVSMNTAQSLKDNMAVVQFFRSKRDYQKIPICLLANEPNPIYRQLTNDSRLRSFSLDGGFFMPYMAMLPMATSLDEDFREEVLGDNFVQSNLLAIFKEKLGSGLELSLRPPTPDEYRMGFYAQSMVEVSSHLGWYKLNLRILKSEQSSLASIMGTNDPDELELIGNKIMGLALDQFRTQIYEELSSKGALFFPSLDEISPQDRKVLLGQAKTNGFVFEAPEIQLLLEVNRYI